MQIATKPVKLDIKSKVVITIASMLVCSLFILIADFFVTKNLLFSPTGPILILIQALFFGFFFPDFLAATMIRQGTQNSVEITPELAENENVEVYGPANLINRNDVLGGKIFLTNTKMLFKSIGNEQVQIPYQSIKKIVDGKTAGIIENKLYVTALDGKRYNFIVNQPGLWKEKLTEKTQG